MLGLAYRCCVRLWLLVRCWCWRRGGPKVCKAPRLRLDLEGRISRYRIRHNRDEEMEGGRRTMRWSLVNRRSLIISRGCLNLPTGHDDVGDATKVYMF